MLHHVALVRTDILEECSASVIRVKTVGELGAALAVTSNWRTTRRSARATWRNILEDDILHSHRREDHKSYIFNNFFFFPSVQEIFSC
jgi:hypothetical protein